MHVQYSSKVVLLLVAIIVYYSTVTREKKKKKGKEKKRGEEITQHIFVSATSIRRTDDINNIYIINDITTLLLLYQVCNMKTEDTLVESKDGFYLARRAVVANSSTNQLATRIWWEGRMVLRYRYNNNINY